MRSRFADKFNHDAEAPGYDRDVLNEHDPIRAGYSELLDWVASAARSGATASIVDLGAGTGNLSERLASFKQLVCVDISREMLRIARADPQLLRAVRRHGRSRFTVAPAVADKHLCGRDRIAGKRSIAEP